jgi:hypothetical protein
MASRYPLNGPTHVRIHATCVAYVSGKANFERLDTANEGIGEIAEGDGIEYPWIVSMSYSEIRLGRPAS